MVLTKAGSTQAAVVNGKPINGRVVKAGKTTMIQSKGQSRRNIKIAVLSRKKSSLLHSSPAKGMIKAKIASRIVARRDRSTKVTTATGRPVSRVRAIVRGNKANNCKVFTLPSKGLRASSPATSNIHIPSIPTSATTASASRTPAKAQKKEYLSAGLYCQDAHPSSSKTLVNVVLQHRSAETKASKAKRSVKPRISRPRRSDTKIPEVIERPAIATQARPTFPPLPYDHGHELFFGQEHEFVLPHYIRTEVESGVLDAKKRPAPFIKVRANLFPERPRISADSTAVCKCAPDSGCGDRCINRIMSYLCGKECPCRENCTNKALNKRKMPAYKVAYAGARGFGVVAMEDIKEGEFVMDYRGEVISIDTFWDRIQEEYKGKRNFYALDYDQDEVIDAGMKGNDARFINHGCDPNLEVRKYQTLGDGWEEYEVGMWALRDITKGEELFYDYNFESFGVAAQSDELRTKCRCGAPNCVGFLGRKVGEKSAKEIAADLEARRIEAARKALQQAKSAKGGKKALSSSGTPSMVSASSSRSRESVEIRTPSLPDLSPNKKRKSLSSSTDDKKDAKRSRESLTDSLIAKAQLVQLESQKKKIATALRKEEEAKLARHKKEEMIKSRNGAPRGWAYVPLRVKAVLPTTSARKPPRDRTITGPARARRSVG